MAVFIFVFSVSAFAEIPNLVKWNDFPVYNIMENGSDSNSDIDFITLRVNPELESSQLHMLFTAVLSSFEDETKAGLRINFNDLGTVELRCDGTEEYDSEIFFAEIDKSFSDEGTMMFGMEITVGIKPGIPDNLILSFNMYDTRGIASNTYEVDITDSYAEEMPEDEEAENSAEEAAKENVKTKKVRTTKYKTTKVKTTKAKTSRTTKSKTAKENTDEDEIEYEVNEKNLQSDAFEDVHVENDKTKLIYICAAAVIACTAGGCAVGIANSRKKKNDRGDDE